VESLGIDLQTIRQEPVLGADCVCRQFFRVVYRVVVREEITPGFEAGLDTGIYEGLRPHIPLHTRPPRGLAPAVALAVGAVEVDRRAAGNRNGPHSADAQRRRWRAKRRWRVDPTEECRTKDLPAHEGARQELVVARVAYAAGQAQGIRHREAQPAKRSVTLGVWIQLFLRRIDLLVED